VRFYGVSVRYRRYLPGVTSAGASPLGLAIKVTEEREKALFVTCVKATLLFGAKAAAVEEDTANKALANIVVAFMESDLGERSKEVARRSK
jgi:TctA family transporter